MALHGQRPTSWILLLTNISVVVTENSTSHREFIRRGLLDCMDACHNTQRCVYTLYTPGYRRCQVQTSVHERRFDIDINTEKMVWGVRIATEHRSCTGRRPYIIHGFRQSSNKTHLLYKCKKRYTETGPIVSLCDDGTWTKPREKCKGRSVLCSSPAPDVPNAHKTRMVSTRQLYECDKGFVHTGAVFAMCAGKEWKYSEQVCAKYGKPKSIGSITDQVSDASGLAASRLHPGYLYTHNDYHSDPVIFVLDASTGEHVASLTIEGASNNDWEDMAVGPCGKHTCMYIGDIGGHDWHRPEGVKPANVIYRVREPLFMGDQTLPVDSKLKFSWDYSNSNTLLVDTDETLYVLSTEDDAPSDLHELPDTWGREDRMKATRYNQIGNCGCMGEIWGGDISPDGNTLVLMVTHGIMYWDLRNGGILEATKTTPEPVPCKLKEGQGAGFKHDSTGFYVLEEGSDLYYFPPA